MSEAPLTANLPEFSVSELSAALKRTVEDAFPFVRVRGEISGLKFAASGHIYFDLKDEKAVLNAIVWKQAARAVGLKPEQGLEVVCTGRVTTYPGSSRYQLIVERMELAGRGALMAMLEARKKKLEAEGLFAPARKKPLPYLPQVIGVVTSPTGAVIRDIMHRLSERFPRRVLLWPVAVQGERAAAEIAAAIAGFNAIRPGGPVPRPDVLIVARGGGSLEDLMAFNEEIVVRAAAASAIPLIAGVGHETDTTLIDFAADRRAPTPTAAAEMAVPVRADLLQQVMQCDQRLLRAFTRGMTQRRTELQSAARALPRADQLFASSRQHFDVASERMGHALDRNLQAHRRAFLQASALLRPKPVRDGIRTGRDRTNVLVQRLGRAHRTQLADRGRRLDGLARILDSVSYRSVLERGFALVRGAEGRVRRRAAAISPGDALTLAFADGEAKVRAEGDGKAVTRPQSKPPSGRQESLF